MTIKTKTAKTKTANMASLHAIVGEGKLEGIRVSPKEIEAQAVVAAKAAKVIPEGTTGKKLTKAKKVLPDDANVKLRCPFVRAKLKFGIDADEYDVCDDCPLLKACKAEKARLKAKKEAALIKKEKAIIFTKGEAVGAILLAHGLNAPKMDVINAAIALVKERNGVATTMDQMNKYYSIGKNVLKGFTAVLESVEK